MNTRGWNGLFLRWGSASGDDEAGLIAGFPVFLLVDPDLEKVLAREASWTMLDAFEALRDAHPEGPSISAIQDVWRECVRSIHRRLAEATIFGVESMEGDDAVPSVRLAGLVATIRDGAPTWIAMSNGDGAILDASGGHMRVIPEQDDVGYDLPGKLWTFPMLPGQRLVLVTAGMRRLTSPGRMLSALSHLRRAERAATTLVTQQGKAAGQAAIVVDVLSPEQAEQLASPPTLLNEIEETHDSCLTESSTPSGAWGLEALGIGSPRGHARRSHTPPPELDDFHFVSYLGSGGFSDVYVYEEQLPRRLVAIKVLSKRSLGGGGGSQFRGEVDLMAQLSGHPSVVPIHDADVAASGQPYVVMEYCPLPSLAERIATRDLPLADALKMGVQIAGAVHTAHIMGIVHYDLKPANVLYSAFGRPLLGDFGIASLVGASNQEVMGASLPWAAPEVLTNKLAGPRADVYSLAATVYTACAGKAPFAKRGKKNRRDYIREVLRGHLEPLVLKGLGQDAVGALNETLSEGMRVEANHRTQSAAELGRALQEVQRMAGHAVTDLEIPPGT
ncbi:serine/threonine-protein kinase [Actinomycetaceae bacterium L2_0104]